LNIKEDKVLRVSVCMAIFNGERFVMDQIESVLSQLSEKDELIISDDGSIDNTVTIIRSINDPRIRLFQSQGSGVVLNFENALNQVTGDVIILCDQDDIWLPGRLKIAVNSLYNHDLVMVNYQVVDSNLNPVESNSPEISLSFFRTFVKNGYLGCCMAFRSSILVSILPFPKGIAMHDWWIALLCLLKFDVFISDQNGILYRRHNSNASSTGEVSQLTLRMKITIRIHLLLALVKRSIGLK